MKPPVQISLIACLSPFSQHNAFLPLCVQRDPSNPGRNLHDWQDVLLSFVRNQKEKKESFEEEALKVTPVISSAWKISVD